MARRSIGKPRFYADTLQYLKVLGYYDGNDVETIYLPTSSSDLGSENGIWNLDPINNTNFTLNGTKYRHRYQINFNKQSINQDLLMTNVPQSDVSGLYAGILGHDFKPRTAVGNNEAGANNTIVVRIRRESTSSASYHYEVCGDITKIVNFEPDEGTMQDGKIYKKGYSFWNIGEITADSDDGHLSNAVEFHVSRPNLGEDETYNIGAFTFGRWFEPEFAFDLKGTISNSYEGVNVQNTVGGSTLSNIKHLGQPNWGNGLPAWAITDRIDEDYNLGGAKGRRSWQVGFSYLTDDKIFNKAGNPDKFFTYDEDTEQHTFDTSLGSFLKLTLNGKLPFIFCPDSSADDLEFALCRVTNQPSFSQVANNLFSTSLTITETW